MTLRLHVNSQKQEFVIGNEEEWNDNNRDKAIRAISRGTLSLTPDVTQRLTPNDVQRLSFVLSRSGKRPKTANEDDDYWRELREKAQLSIPDGAPYFYTKHFDSDKGHYYYYDHVSGASTWDKPPGGDDMEIHRPESLVESMFKRTTDAAIERRKLLERRRIAYDTFQNEKAQEMAAEWLAKENAELRRVETIWKTACVDASQKNGSLELSWIKLDFINPLIYDFSIQFGMPLQILFYSPFTNQSLLTHTVKHTYCCRYAHACVETSRYRFTQSNRRSSITASYFGTSIPGQ